MQNKPKLAGAIVAIGVAAITYGITLLFGFNQEVAIAIALGIWIGFSVASCLTKCKQKACENTDDNQEIVSLFIGNLPFKTKETELREMFAEIGTVHSIKIPRDRKSGRARGFGFIEMGKADAQKAIKQLNDKELNGRNLRINEAKESNDDDKS